MATPRTDDPSAKRRVCILSGGGDAPGVNAILRAFVHASHRHGVEVLGCRYGFEGLLAPDGIVPFGRDAVRGVLFRGGCVLGCSTRVNPFFLEDPRTGAPRDLGPAIVDRLRSLGVEALVLVGGDGTMLAAARFGSLGMPCIGVPKTIDDDLAGTERCCGFDSAVAVATHAVDALHATAEAHARVMIVEVMGRNAGWIALHAGLAGGADVVLLPEIPYGVDRVVAKIKEREALGLRFTIVVVAEGAAPEGGHTAEIAPGTPGHLPRLGGAGAALLAELERRDIGHEVRLTVLGHLQRGGSPTASDRIFGTRLGAAAAELVARRAYGRMLAWRAGRLDEVPLDPARPLHRRVDADEPLVAAARAVGIEFGA